MISPHADPSRVGTPFEDVPFSDWAWQVRNRIDSEQGLSELFTLSEDERAGFGACRPVFRFAVTPYYAMLADRENPDCPIRRQIVPRPEERVVTLGARGDPLGEEPREVAPNLIHRYPDRVLLLATDRCPLYCRFCTRRRIVGRTERQSTRAQFAEALDYVRAHEELREVIVSGGDALMLGDKVLAQLLSDIRGIPHIDVIRIASRMLVTCPMRVTDALADVLAEHRPVYVMTHFNHPKECTVSAAEAIERLVTRGVQVYNQTVLLRGINDDASVIEALNRRLVAMSTTPYYLHQCDMAEGIEHFRTPLSTGLQIIDRLRGHTSGLMVPQFCVDVPGGLGKVTLLPEWQLARTKNATHFRTYTGEVGVYPDPQIEAQEEPSRDDTHRETQTSDALRFTSLTH